MGRAALHLWKVTFWPSCQGLDPWARYELACFLSPRRQTPKTKNVRVDKGGLQNCNRRLLQSFVFETFLVTLTSTSSQTSEEQSNTTMSTENPRKWRFTWEAQSHVPILRLFIFDSYTRPSVQCQNLKVHLNPSQSLVLVSWFEDLEVSLRVPTPRVLVDPESPVSFRAFDDHIEVKLVLLLPVDHPIVSSFDSVLNFSEGRENAVFDALKQLEMDSGEISMLYLLNISAICEIKMRLVAEKNLVDRKAKIIVYNRILCTGCSLEECERMSLLLCFNLLFIFFFIYLPVV